MTENTSGSGNSDFNEIPSWYQEATPHGAQAAHGQPPAPGAPPAPGFNQGQAFQVGQQPAKSSGAARVAKGMGVGLVARLGIGAVVLGAGALFTLGSTSAEDLEAGDCFQMADTVEIERVDTPGCSEPHDSEVVGIVEIARAGAYPADSDPYWIDVLNACDDAAFSTIVNFEAAPQDATLEILTPVEAGWNAGDRETLCVVFSPSGLNGSLTGLKE